MFRHIYIVALVFIIAFSTITPAQESTLMWLGEFIYFSELPILQTRHSNYSESDLRNFQERLKSLHSETVKTEWEGVFVPGGMDMVGISILRISFKSGFGSLYIYTCTPELRAIDYGAAVESPDFVELISEVPAGSPRKPSRVRLVKVKWGPRIYLVNEKSLRVWAEKAVGRYVPRQDGYEQGWADYWEGGELEAPVSGLPALPMRFRRFSRKPIEASIISVRPRVIKSEFSSGNTFHSADSAVYRVVINAGSKKGVSNGMAFAVRGSHDELTVTRVGSSTSEAVIVRAINDDTRADHCLSDDSRLIKCPAITGGLSVTTFVGRFWL